MTVPSAPTATTTPASEQLYREWLAHHGLSLPAHRIRQAVDTLERLRPQLEELRAIPLSFLTDVVEPATALQWIEQGGRS